MSYTRPLRGETTIACRSKSSVRSYIFGVSRARHRTFGEVTWGGIEGDESMCLYVHGHDAGSAGLASGGHLMLCSRDVHQGS